MVAMVGGQNTAVIKDTALHVSISHPEQNVVVPDVLGMGAIVAVTLVMEALTVGEILSAEAMVVKCAAPLIHTGDATMGVGTIQEMFVGNALSLDLVVVVLTLVHQAPSEMMQIMAMLGGGLV